MVFPEGSLERQLITHLEQNLDIADLVRQLFKENPLFLHQIYLAVKTDEDAELFKQLLEKLPQEILHAALLSLDQKGNTLFFLLVQEYESDISLYSKIIELTDPEVMSQVWLTANSDNFLPLCFAIKERDIELAQMLVEIATAEAIHQAFDNAENNKKTIWHTLIGFSDNFDPLFMDELIENLQRFFKKVNIRQEQVDKVFNIFCHDGEEALIYLLAYQVVCPDQFTDAEIEAAEQNQQIVELADKSGISIILLNCLQQYVSLPIIETAIDYMLEQAGVYSEEALEEESEEILEEVLENKHGDVDFQNIDLGEIEEDIVEEDEQSDELQPKPQKHTYSVFYNDDSSEKSSLCDDSQPKPPFSPSP